MRAESSMPRQEIQVMTRIQTHAGDGDRGGVGGQVVQPEQQEPVDAGDLRQRRHHDDVGGHDRPAGQPAGVRPEGLGDPGETGAAVRAGRC